MCGIVALFDNGHDLRKSEVILRDMTEALHHRGPDGDGFVIDRHVALGHRRLAIIDLSPDARQPMVTADGRYAISFNGMIYNYRELREELIGHGVRFFSASDTEVLLQAVVTWGPSCVSRLNGMFSFVFIDRLQNTAVIARDRYGIKPLYFAHRGTLIAFASEIKALLKHPDISARINKEGLLEYFTFQNFFSSHTLFQGIDTFPPGMILTISGGRETWHRYWDFNFSPSEPEASYGDYQEELDRLFQRAVQRQLASDVPVGSYLSGGIDSGSIAAVAAAAYRGLRTFTIGFRKQSASGIEVGFEDERDLAEMMADAFSTEHYEMVLKSGDMVGAMESIVWHLEEPRVGQSYPNYYAAKLASLACKVVLSGAGGDELFAGYPWRYYRAAVSDTFDSYVDKYYLFWQRLIPNRTLHEVFHPIWNEVKDFSSRDIFSSVLRDHSAGAPSTPEEYINLSLYFEAKTFLHGLLVVDDKLSMAHGIEGRVPFLDNDLVDFATRIPIRYKLDNLGEVLRQNENDPGPKAQEFFLKTRDGKKILRSVMGRHVPSAVSTAVKRGFTGPDDSWFRGPSIDYVKKTLLARDARIYDYMDRAATTDLIMRHLDGRENRRLLIWSLLNFELWCRRFLQ